MENTINTEIVKTLYSKRKHLIIVVAVSAVLAVVFSSSFFLRPKFKSTAVVYPTNMGPFSEESSTEQLIQFMNSQEIRYRLLNEFNLAKHFRLDTADDKFDTYFNYMFEENIKITQTRYESVQIDVLAFDRDTARLLAWAIINFSNDLIRNSLNAKTEEFVKMHEEHIAALNAENDSLKAVLTKWGLDYGLLDYFIQIKEASRNLYKSLGASGNVNAKMEEQLKNIKEKGPRYMEMMEQFKNNVGIISEAQKEISKARRDLKKTFTYSTIVSKPNLPDTKFWPKRGIIVMFSTLGTLLLACIYFIYIERLKKIRKEIAQE